MQISDDRRNQWNKNINSCTHIKKLLRVNPHQKITTDQKEVTTPSICAGTINNFTDSIILQKWIWNRDISK